MKEPDRKTTRTILQHWRWYAKDLPPDSAEVNYYTVSPMFRDYALPTPKSITYDEKTALMVEDVMGELYKWRPKQREWLILYWLYIPNNQDLADALSDPDARARLPLQFLTHKRGLGVRISKRTVERKMAESYEAFAKHWGLRFMGG